MWAQDVAQPSTSLTPAPSSRPPSTSPNNGLAPPSHPDFEGVSRGVLINHLHQLQAQLNTYDLKVRCLERAHHQATQESLSNEAEGDEPLENGRPGPQQIPEMVRPDVRIVVPDVLGMRVEHPSDETWSRQMSGSGDGASANGQAGAAPTVERSSQQVVAHDSLPLEQKCEVLIQALGHCQRAMQEIGQKKEEAEEMNHSLLTQLSAAQLARKEEQETNARLKDEIVTKDDQIKDLKRQLQRLKRDEQRHLSLRPGVKRGRFVMSRASTVECFNCGRVFASEEDAGNSACCHHPRPACPLPNKMVAEVFPTEQSKYRYWPCCQQIGTKVPPPCFRGVHNLKVV